MKSSPWLKSTLQFDALGARLRLSLPHDVFSAIGIDEGTLLLLDHLPAGSPVSVLDMGCGYGPLGLPIAARFPGARVEMVDRDLLVLAFARSNALANGLANAVVYGSLGFRDLRPRDRPFDWILCNVPARIGRPFIAHLLEAGRALLAPAGELRVVVIRDLVPVVEGLRAELDLPLTEEARGPRHSVWALRAEPSRSAAARPGEEPAVLYARDHVAIAGLDLERPNDLGGDEPQRIGRGLPVLLDVLPRQAPRRVLAFRCGYGTLPLVACARWPDARVVAVDRDLLATTFTRHNAARLGVSHPRLEVRESAHFPDALAPEERFDLAIGELSPSAGEGVAAAELEALARVLEHGGQALVLSLEKLERTWVRRLAEKRRFCASRVIAREGYALSRVAPSW